MTGIILFGQFVPVDFMRGEGASGTIDQAAILASVAEMEALINSCTFPQHYVDAFTGIRRIIFFDGQVRVNGHLMDRPCCDEDDAIFYWEIEEFLRNMDADVHANTLFHDCWHVVQFKRAGNRFAANQDEQLSREVDAIIQQIEVARTLGCAPHEIAHLERFLADHPAILARLSEGVEESLMPHRTGDFMMRHA